MASSPSKRSSSFSERLYRLLLLSYPAKFRERYGDEMRAGLITADQARAHPQRNIITRCLGTKTEVEVDIFSEKVQEGDLLVLCTDGLSSVVSDEELGAILQQFQPQESAYQLIERANEQGGPDNITAIVVQVSQVSPTV